MRFLFEKRVKEMKAWQLYVGQSMWLFFIGIFFFVLKLVIDKLFMPKSPVFRKGYNVVESIATGTATSGSGQKFASDILGKQGALAY